MSKIPKVQNEISPIRVIHLIMIVINYLFYSIINTLKTCQKRKFEILFRVVSNRKNINWNI